MTIVCFGEMLLRLAPANGAPLGEADAFALHVAGAEANVAIALASLGTSARMASILSDNALGDRALRALTSAGVDALPVLRRPGRMGLFFIEAPRSGREGGYFYDRADSAFARGASRIDWHAALEGARWLHLSGLTAALGDGAIEAMRAAVAAARLRGVGLSFDCNFRPLLWERREAEASARLAEFCAAADLLFAADADARLMLGADACVLDLLEAFPRVQRIASTSRVHTAGGESLGACLLTRTQHIAIAPTIISPYVDRIGAGDAFAAGLLHGVSSGWDDAITLDFAHATCLVKHGTPGDFCTASEAEIRAEMRGGVSGNGGAVRQPPIQPESCAGS